MNTEAEVFGLNILKVVCVKHVVVIEGYNVGDRALDVDRRLLSLHAAHYSQSERAQLLLSNELIFPDLILPHYCHKLGIFLQNFKAKSLSKCEDTEILPRETDVLHAIISIIAKISCVAKQNCLH